MAYSTSWHTVHALAFAGIRHSSRPPSGKGERERGGSVREQNFSKNRISQRSPLSLSHSLPLSLTPTLSLSPSLPPSLPPSLSLFQRCPPSLSLSAFAISAWTKILFFSSKKPKRQFHRFQFSPDRSRSRCYHSGVFEADHWTRRWTTTRASLTTPTSELRENLTQSFGRTA